jgi:hypothetical protein
MLDNAKPSPPFAALVATFSNAPDEIPMSQPKSAPASAGNAKFLSTAPLRSRSPSRARSPASERPAFEAARRR